MQKKHLITLALMLQIPFVAQAQRYSKLVVKSQEVFEVGPDNMLVVDTLIMQDKATIRFTPGDKGMLGARIAYVGEDCVISAKGHSGEHGSLNVPGVDGDNGSNMELDIHFMTLGSLTIDTRGGNGGDGYIGRNSGRPKSSVYTRIVKDNNGGYKTVSHTAEIGVVSQSEPGTPPGSGGNGGDITFTYSTDNFIPNFNHNQRKRKYKEQHLIEVTYKAGEDGKDGRDGAEVHKRVTIPGKLITKPHPQKQDGKIKLINANKPM